MTNHSPAPPHMFATLSDGRFPGYQEYVSPPFIERVKRAVKTAIEKQEEKRAYKQRYKTEHRDKYLEQKRSDSRNRRAAKRAAGGTIKACEWRELCNMYGNVCLCCGEAKSLTLDHVLPIAVGGTNTIHNAQPLCAMCNSVKGAKYIDYR